MNKDLIGRLLRTGLQIGGTYLVATGKITEGDAAALMGAIITVATTIYTVYASWKTEKKLEAAKAA